MNVDVLHRLGEAVAERGPGAYVLTVSSDGRPHAVYLNVVWNEGRLVAEVGNSTAANASSSCAADCLPVMESPARLTIAPPR